MKIDWLKVGIITEVVVIGGMFASGVYGCRETNRRDAEKERLAMSRLDQFLATHGDTVRVLKLEETTEAVSTGKYSVGTVAHAYLHCRFVDGYTIDIEQDRSGPTSQVALPGERWKIRRAGTRFYFYQRILESGK